LVAKLGAVCARYRWVVIVLWIILLAGMISTTKLVDVNENEGLTVPGSSASRGADTLNRAFPASNSGTPGQIVVFGAPGAMKVKATQDVITKAIKDIKTLPSMGMVGDPFAEPSTVSPDGSTALINIRYTVNINDIKPAMYTHLQAVIAPVKAVPDLQEPLNHVSDLPLLGKIRAVKHYFPLRYISILELYLIRTNGGYGKS